MVRCKLCGKTVPNEEFFPHLHTEHPEEMQEIRCQPKRRKPPKTPTAMPEKPDTSALEDKLQTKATLNPVQAAIMEFVGEKLQTPMTPALIYGYFCAKKMGFEGNVGEFLQDVIDDFYQARGINYYEEVMK